MDIYTAQYRYSGPDRVDITVKGASSPGVVLAPTWEMVTAHKSEPDKHKADLDYAIKYFPLIVKRVFNDRSMANMLSNIISMNRVVLVCFCRPGDFCHRVLAAKMLQELGYGTYRGEIPV
jgi:hypothetical protein